MKRTEKLPELLSPAGGMEALYAAVAGGADAVYAGGKRFGARASAKNFSLDELRDAAVYCHLHGVRLYVTVNILLFDRELDAAVDFCRDLQSAGVDAVIAADAGLIARLGRDVPRLAVHASTQFSAHSLRGADVAAWLGASRVVLARELPLADIRKITEQAKAEIEVFLHGALCVCHSGQCLFSSVVGGRSGNRGECAQPCRLPYNGKTPLSLRDLSLADHIPELIASGVSSLKIEGRMKAPAYVWGVTRVYRRLLDEGRCATKEENAILARLFSRGGFTDGYFTGRIRDAMTGTRTEDAREASRELNEATFSPDRVKITAKAEVRAGSPCKLCLTYQGRTVSVDGAVPAAAQNAALTEDALRARLLKMGDTPFALDNGDLTVSLDPGLFLPVSAVNDLRRRAAAALAEAFRAPLEESAPAPTAIPAAPAPEEDGDAPLRTALFYDADAYRRSTARDFFDLCFLPLFSPWDAPDFPMPKGIALPPVVTEREEDAVLARMKQAKAAGAAWALLENPGQLSLCREAALLPYGDFRLNVTNRESREVWRRAGISRLVLSPELTLPQARDAGGALPVYGRIPLMITERCFVRENGGCDKCGHFALCDRRNAEFPILREYPHRNLIFNSIPTYMGDKQEELARYRIRDTHFIFSVETAEEIDRVAEAFRCGVAIPNVRRTPRENGGTH